MCLFAYYNHCIFIKFIGKILVNASCKFQVDLYNVTSIWSIVCSPPKLQSPLVNIYLTPFTLFILPPYFPSGSYYSVVYIYEFILVCLHCYFSFHILFISETKRRLSFSISLISFSIILSRSIQFVANGNISPFCQSTIPSYNVPPLYPIIH